MQDGAVIQHPFAGADVPEGVAVVENTLGEQAEDEGRHGGDDRGERQVGGVAARQQGHASR